MIKTCPECNEKIIGREDKKFCSDGCRNSYNNKINKDSTNYMRNVNNKLRKNYRILSELNTDGKSKATVTTEAGVQTFEGTQAEVKAKIDALK